MSASRRSEVFSRRCGLSGNARCSFGESVPRKSTFGRLVRFLTVGGCALLVDFGTLWLLSRRVIPTLAFSAAYLAGVTTHFTLNKFWTFQCARTDLLKQLSEYVTVMAITYLIQLTGFRLGLILFHEDLFLAKAVAVPPSTLVGFALLRARVFREAGEAVGLEE